jgi:glycosyltransferase involved in cell wall biosynthesis
MAPALDKGIKRFDIIHLHEFRTVPNVIAHHYVQKYGIPYVVQAHGSVPIWGRRTLKRVYDILWGHRLIDDAAKLIASTKMESEYYLEMGARAEQIEIVPNGVELSEFADLPARGVFKGKFGLNERRIILFLGRIDKVKGIDILLKACAHLFPEVNNIHLVIAGPDDGYLRPLQSLARNLGIAESVLFPGALYGESKLEAYVDADVYVLPSVYENFGITILEALACGTPVIISDKCGLADKIKGRAGIVVPRDEANLRDALCTMLTDEPVRQGFIDAGRKLIEEEFTWQRVAEKMESVYHSVLGAA